MTLGELHYLSLNFCFLIHAVEIISTLQPFQRIRNKAWKRSAINICRNRNIVKKKNGSYQQCYFQELVVRIFCLFFCFCLHQAACRFLPLWSGIEPWPTAVKAPSLNHWTTKKLPEFDLFLFLTNLFIFGCVVSSLLCVGLTEVASLVAEHWLQILDWVVVVHRLLCPVACGTQASLPCGMWNLHRSGIRSMCPALADGILPTGLPRKSQKWFGFAEELRTWRTS